MALNNGAREYRPILHDRDCHRGQIFPGEHLPLDTFCSRCRYLMGLLKSTPSYGSVKRATERRRRAA